MYIEKGSRTVGAGHHLLSAAQLRSSREAALTRCQVLLDQGTHHPDEMHATELRTCRAYSRGQTNTTILISQE